MCRNAASRRRIRNGVTGTAHRTWYKPTRTYIKKREGEEEEKGRGGQDPGGQDPTGVMMDAREGQNLMRNDGDRRRTLQNGVERRRMHSIVAHC